MTKIGFLHPGEMGIALAASARRAGFEACWVSAGRGPDTHARAEAHGLRDLASLEALCRECPIVFAVCPPHAAAAQAEAVITAGFRGLYVDANAIAPNKVRAIAARLGEAGIDFVDGGIVGLPPSRPGTTWLYLSGPRADEAAVCFSAGPLEIELLGDEIGRASALKMCFAANTKGTTALLTAILGAAESLGVREALERQWERYESGSAERTRERIRGVARKAWRFTGEMEEIAATLADAGMPPGFHEAAAEIYARQEEFKDREKPDFDTILKALRQV